MFDGYKTRMIGLKLWHYVKPFSSNTGTSRTDRRTDRRADRQTDRQTELLLVYQYRASVCWRAIIKCSQSWCNLTVGLNGGAKFFSCRGTTGALWFLMRHDVARLIDRKRGFWLKVLLKITKCHRWVLKFIRHTTYNLSIYQMKIFVWSLVKVIKFIGAHLPKHSRGTCPVWPRLGAATVTFMHNYVVLIWISTIYTL